MTSPPDTLWALLLTNRLTQVDAKPYSAVEFWKLLSRLGDELGHPVESAEDVVSGASLSEADASRVRTLLDAGRAFGFERERLEESGLRVVSALDEHFPVRLRERLGRNCPPFLIVAGDLDRLSQGGLGVAGSRNASEESLTATRGAAIAAVERGWTVVTGLARGVDQVASDAALAAGGAAVGIPAEGIHVVSRRSHVRRAVHSGALTVASPYGPNARFTAGTAMGRNKIIYALSTAAFVASADEDSGGTWAGAVENLKRGWCPVGVWTGSGAREGNEALVAKGAHPITDVAELFDMPAADVTESSQTTLF